MKLFAAGAGLGELEACLRQGLCTGVVVDRGSAGPADAAPTRDLVVALGRLVDGPVFVDVAGPGAPPHDATALEGAARALGAIGGSVVARIPFGEPGLAAIRACAKAGIATNAVGCTTPVDAIAAARAGARWISPSWELPPGGAARGALLGSVRGLIAALLSFDATAEVLVGPAPDRSILVDLAFAGAHAGSARSAALHEIARRRAEGLAAAGSGS